MATNEHAHRLQLTFFAFIALIVLVLNFFIFLPYASVLFLAGVFAIVFRPIFGYLNEKMKGRRVPASILTVGLIFITILLPVILLGFLVFQQASDVYLKLANQEVGSLLESKWSVVQDQIQTIAPNASLELEGYIRQGLSLLVSHLDTFFSGLLKTVFSFFLLMLGLFYLFKDGDQIKQRLIKLSPLQNVHDREIFKRVEISINSVVRGFIVVAVVQGILTGIGFAIFGIPAPVLWGLVASIAALVPSVGTALVIAPGVLYLFWSGQTFAAVGLLVWGVLAVGLVDNILGPILMRRGTAIHPFVILLSVLGGVALLGPIGFLAGPVFVSLLIALFDMAPVIMQKENGQ
ncbi:MAG TPA: AI-2E family transporter [Candidatus Paceibacterota bacterium]|nr:AI-2E family transporter [Candidatus Paceibacterota bacterium]